MIFLASLATTYNEFKNKPETDSCFSAASGNVIDTQIIDWILTYFFSPA